MTLIYVRYRSEDCLYLLSSINTSQRDLQRSISILVLHSELYIQDWIQKIENDVDIFQHQGGNGLKPSITQPQRNLILKTVKEDPLRSSTRRLVAQSELSKTSIHTILKEEKVSSQGKEIEKLFSEDELEMFKKNFHRIYHTYFSDESGINLCDAHKSKI